MTFPGLEITILKFHDFSKFSMTVRILEKTSSDCWYSCLYVVNMKLDQWFSNCEALLERSANTGGAPEEMQKDLYWELYI